jgi:hypothetical protein
MHAEAVRLLAGDDEPAAGRIDREAARLRLRGPVADGRERSVGRDGKARERARAAFARVEEAAVGRAAQLGRPGLAGKARRQDGDRLQVREAAAGVVVRRPCS